MIHAAARTLAAVGLAACTCGTLLSACSSVTTDLLTARDLYRDARYEAAALWLDSLAGDAPAMAASDRATFHYLVGMTEYRLAHYQDALHDLALAAHAASTQNDALSPTQRSVLDRTMAELMPVDASPYARSAAAADRDY